MDENIIYKEESVIKLKDICEMFTGKTKIHSKYLNKYKNNIQEWIKIKYPEIENECKKIKSLGCILGWKYLDFN